MEVTLYGGKRQLLSFNKGYPISGSMITRVCKKNQRAKRSQMIKMIRMHWLLIYQCDFQARAEEKGQGRVVDFYKIFAVSFATIAAILSV